MDLTKKQYDKNLKLALKFIAQKGLKKEYAKYICEHIKKGMKRL